MSHVHKGEYKGVYYLSRKHQLAVNARKCNKIAKQEAINLLGGRCNECGTNDLSLLTIDHINNDGSQDRKNNVGMAGTPLYFKIVSGKRKLDDIQVLCFNCNLSKRSWGGMTAGEALRTLYSPA